jgi:hypothetical protein
MADTTQLVMGSKRMGMPRFAKRLVQAGLGAALTAAIFLVVMVGNGLLVGQRRSLEAGFNLWLAFVQRPEIYTTIGITALVTMLLLYWQRDQERRPGGRP